MNKITEWLMPALIGASIYYLQCITTEMKEMNHTLTVAVERVEQHERRIQALEAFHHR